MQYYFGDYNLPRDSFLREQEDGWVTMEGMLKFKRLAQLSMDPEAILKAMRKSKSGLMEICDRLRLDGVPVVRIRRSVLMPLPADTEEFKKEVQGRTVYCKGFPKKDTNLDKLLTFFKNYEGVVNIKVGSTQ